MMLQATELGLDTVWVCYFKPDIVKAEFNLSDKIEPINILVIGYGASKPEPSDRHMKTRHSISNFVSYEKLN